MSINFNHVFDYDDIYHCSSSLETTGVFIAGRGMLTWEEVLRLVADVSMPQIMGEQKVEEDAL